ncbi:MAG: ATP-binding protein [candidate division NC10 bacterium]|nr:ATP-binding protein [candidate division NC10 bacterium]
MVRRSFWERRIEAAWRRRSVVWLMGVRRVGKSVLSQSLPDVRYYDCELPRVRRLLDDPESFLADQRGRRIVLDEIHRLPNPAEVLKIAADHFPATRILATGSSTLGASARFRDTLAGRKEEVWLTPMSLADLEDFGNTDLRYRLLRGGLPPFFLAGELPEREFQEWLDAYWAKDILELFRLERRQSFQRLVELLMAQSGGIFEATGFARACEVSRTTIANYVAVLESTFVVHLIRPFAGGGAAEIVSAPKVYGFDTGFVCYHRGWHELRREDLGLLWEHLVLNELHAHLGQGAIHYWRSKHGNEVDFVLARRGQPPTVIECKWSAAEFDPASLKVFRSRYLKGSNYVVSADVGAPLTRRYGALAVRFVSLAGLLQELVRSGRPRGQR